MSVVAPHVEHAPIPVVLCVDVEPDGFFLDPRGRDPWLGFERAVEFFETLRGSLSGGDTSAARFTWTVRMDPQVAEVYGRADWAASTYRRQFEQLQARGDDVGVHTHAYRRDGASWTLDYGDPSWTEHCVRTSCESFADTFWRPCRTFRFGDRWTSGPCVRLLEALGVRYDLTLEPGLPGGPFGHHGDRVTGTLPDLTDAPTHPYHPSLDDYRRPSSTPGGLWMIPLSTARVSPPLWRQVAYRLWRRGSHQGMSTLLLSHEPSLFTRIVGDVLTRPGPPYLAIAMRCNAVLTARLVRRITTNVETLRRHPWASRFAYVTPSAVPSMVRADAGE